ncbi:MAG TPA: phosphoglucomutase/phosphomannomutase family protein, partial [Patescibacteria group bacterium]|nr:phosphoglucomutase/phosphomannomutase family protein [Patescibacteria group bacterium]
MGIRFGTDGWRAVIAEEFTFANVRRVCAGIEQALRGTGDGSVVVGYDTRFLSRRFAEAAAETLMGAGRSVVLAAEASPTPASSCQVVATSAPFAIVITASHNPAIFNGVKVKDSNGSSAGSEITSACERSIPAATPAGMELMEGRRRGLLTEISFVDAHQERLSRMVDLRAIRDAGIKVANDPMHGSAGRLLETLLSGGRTRVTT